VLIIVGLLVGPYGVSIFCRPGPPSTPSGWARLVPHLTDA
jgi:hypothetical protein